MISVMVFDILTQNKSYCFFNFFLKSYFSLMTWVISPSTLNFDFYLIFSVLWLRSWVWQVNPIDSFFFLLISSFNIVYDWELGFTTYFGLFFIRLSRPYDSKIIFDGLTRADLTYFLCHFLIRSFTNFISQYCIQHDWMKIELYNLFWI